MSQPWQSTSLRKSPPGSLSSIGANLVISISEITVIQEGSVEVQPISSFQDAGLHPAMLRNVELAQYHAPTPVQKFTLPAIHNGYDIIATAQTGKPGETSSYKPLG